MDGRLALWRRGGAEAVGTFALVFAGCGAIVVDEISGGGVTPVGIALTFGLVIAVMVYANGHLSGAHFNPAVTLAFAAIGRFPWRDVPAYWAAQLFAALAAALALDALLGPTASLGATLPAGSLGQSFGLEVACTFFLMFVIVAVATDDRAEGGLAGVAIGGTVLLAALFAGPISGASLNPARSIGPALVAGELRALWLYVAAPAVGAALGAFVYERLRGDG